MQFPHYYVLLSLTHTHTQKFLHVYLVLAKPRSRIKIKKEHTLAIEESYSLNMSLLGHCK